MTEPLHFPGAPGRTRCDLTSKGRLLSMDPAEVDCPGCMELGPPEVVQRTPRTWRRTGRHRVWTTDEQRRLRELHADGVPLEDIAAQLGRTRAAIQGKVHSLRLRRRGTLGRRRRINHRRAYTLRLDGLTWRVIAQRLRCSGTGAWWAARTYAAEAALPWPPAREAA